VPRSSRSTWSRGGAPGRRGDGWVKLVGTGSTARPATCCPAGPRTPSQAAIARAHELGVRVTAHVFGEQALRDLLDADIDCVEHGSGLTDDLVALMAEHGTALVPTRLQLDNFPRYADQGEARFPAYAATMRGLHARLPETLRAAFDAGIPVYAGTDAGGVMDHGLIAREVQALHASGLSATDALAGASWGRAGLARRPRPRGGRLRGPRRLSHRSARGPGGAGRPGADHPAGRCRRLGRPRPRAHRRRPVFALNDHRPPPTCRRSAGPAVFVGRHGAPSVDGHDRRRQGAFVRPAGRGTERPPRSRSSSR
jgi:hypothetical protein